LRTAASGEPEPIDLDALLTRAGRGDEAALGQLYDQMGSAVFGLARRIIRDPSRAEEVTQEVFVQVWQSATRFDSSRGSARSWLLTLAHRRAVDAVRHDQAASDRERRYDWSSGPDFDVVEETVSVGLEHEQVRRCLDGLTDIQREAIVLAFYQGNTYTEVAELLDANQATVKTRMRDGLIRLRDCMGVEA
jgi:RNA polymerase sigma-70 factor (ECF subfamily)